MEEILLTQFTRGRGFEETACVAPRFSGADCVKRARSRVGENRDRFWSNNCEHFSEWCVAGTDRSLQVEAWRTRINNALAALGLAINARKPEKRHGAAKFAH